MTNALATRYRPRGIDTVAGIEARGFVTASPVAHALECGLVLLRKPGKLPWETVCQSYDLEYGQDALEMHKDAVKPGSRVVVIDDLLATGGTMRAAIDLIRAQGGEVVEVAFIVELAFLGGRQRLGDVPSTAIVTF
jgi:adenine phosphoribosyltransferase